MLPPPVDETDDQRDGRKYGTGVWNYNLETSYGIGVLGSKYGEIIRTGVWKLNMVFSMAL